MPDRLEIDAESFECPWPHGGHEDIGRRHEFAKDSLAAVIFEVHRNGVFVSIQPESQRAHANVLVGRRRSQRVTGGGLDLDDVRAHHDGREVDDANSVESTIHVAEPQRAYWAVA